MSNSREYQKNILKNATGNMDSKQLSKRLIIHKSKKFIIVILLIAAVVFAAFGYNIYIKNRIYTDYEVLSISELTQNVESEYLEFNNKVLRYGMDGIVCLEKDNSKVWEISYQMRYPIVALCKGYGVVASQNGKDIYIFNEEKPKQIFKCLLNMRR